MINSGLNRVILVGKLGRQPALTYLDGGLAKASILLICQSKHRDARGHMVSKSDWIPVTLWEEEAERIHQQCRKGSLLLVEGELHYQGTNPPPPGTNSSPLYVEGKQVMILDQRPLPLEEQDSAKPIGNVNPLEAFFTTANSDEIPF